MDTTKEYIKMCDCPEIQEKGFENGDEKTHSFYVCKVCHTLLSEDDGYYYGNIDCEDHNGTMWLPRQDQLQDMVKGYISNFQAFMGGVATKKYDENLALIRDQEEYEYYIHFDTMEKLWLAFVMEKMYGMRWDGKEWRYQAGYSPPYKEREMVGT